MITDCQPDTERLAPLRESMETYGVKKTDPEWPWNVLSLKTVVFSCGAIRREGADNGIHRHDPVEFALCQRLAEEAAKQMEGVEVGMGSESSDHFAPFFIVANSGTPPLHALTEDTIRQVFGDTIYPKAQLWVEPLVEGGAWWLQVRTDFELDDAEDESPGQDESEEVLRPWRALIQWFASQPDLHQSSFVMIGEDPLSEENGGCVFPRLALALTVAGSVVGICSHVVHT